MQQVQDRLDFKIDTPSDEHIREAFELEARERASHMGDIFNGEPKHRKACTPKTKNQKKRARKAQRKSRKVTA